MANTFPGFNVPKPTKVPIDNLFVLSQFAGYKYLTVPYLLPVLGGQVSSIIQGDTFTALHFLLLLNLQRTYRYTFPEHSATHHKYYQH